MVEAIACQNESCSGKATWRCGACCRSLCGSHRATEQMVTVEFGVSRPWVKQLSQCVSCIAAAQEARRVRWSGWQERKFAREQGLTYEESKRLPNPDQEALHDQLRAVPDPFERLLLTAEVWMQNSRGSGTDLSAPEGVPFGPTLALLPEYVARRDNGVEIVRWAAEHVATEFAARAVHQGLHPPLLVARQEETRGRFGRRFWRATEYPAWGFPGGSSRTGRDSSSYEPAWVLEDGRCLFGGTESYGPSPGEHKLVNYRWVALRAMSHELGLRKRHTITAHIFT